ncbi:uncharacterized protein FOMMEDRAFT_153851 [Fomitiporia mediterranea MF3/22]|uniref:uncharacterized protein n=1 Tax=Fomitiporia mediterranea (strain MF3/22) TaxID=694068 RepID=UPI000440968B|nr:uncharacterized protein FOMMEDRAFT_153851 [Fomitiporia mediterranea MF3/22]EJD04760.1 hypothetical protein FOMMEDRAFT_153851 [Fomitiporia mediterranea MF3/22]
MLPIILEAAFHRHNALPFSDVFSALGWFISYAEPPVADLERTQFRLLCYTRLCYNLGKEIGKIKPKKAKKPYFPTVTHVFIEGNWTALTTEENRSTLHLTMSLSSSLPVSTAGKKYPDAKIILRQKRLEALGNIRNSPWMQQAPTMREVTQGMYQTNQGMAGNCAETLNLASGVSQQDMGTGWTYGNLPAGYAEDDNWPVRQSSSNRPDWGYNEYSEARSSQEGTLPMLAGRPVNGSPDYWRNVGQGHAFVVLRR